jgi:hypothetical protein
MKYLMIIAAMLFFINTTAQFNQSQDYVTNKLDLFKYKIINVSQDTTTIKIEKRLYIKYCFNDGKCDKILIHRNNCSIKFLQKWLSSQQFKALSGAYLLDNQCAIIKQDLNGQNYIEITNNLQN